MVFFKIDQSMNWWRRKKLTILLNLTSKIKNKKKSKPINFGNLLSNPEFALYITERTKCLIPKVNLNIFAKIFINVFFCVYGIYCLYLTVSMYIYIFV